MSGMTKNGDWYDALVDQLPFAIDPSKPVYVLVVDGQNRMAVAYLKNLGNHRHKWVSAKPIGIVTHWMPLPMPPQRTTK